MSDRAHEAQIRASAWALVAAAGENRAIEVLNQIASEIRNSQWAGPGGR